MKSGLIFTSILLFCAGLYIIGLEVKYHKIKRENSELNFYLDRATKKLEVAASLMEIFQGQSLECSIALNAAQRNLQLQKEQVIRHNKFIKRLDLSYTANSNTASTPNFTESEPL